MFIDTNTVERCLQDGDLRLMYRYDIDVLFIRWEGNKDSKSLRGGYLSTLEMAVEYEAHYWVLDLRGRRKAEDADEHWLYQEYYDIVKKSLSQRVYMAYVLVPDHYQIVVPRIPHAEIQKHDGWVRVKMFMLENEAVAWLTANKAEEDKQKKML